MERFDPKQIEIDGHHGADAQKAFDTRYRSRAYSDV